MRSVSNRPQGSPSMATSDTLPARHLDYTLTRFDRFRANLTLLRLSRVWRVIAGAAIGWIVACTATAAIIAWRMYALYGPSIWSRISHASQMKMLARYVTVTFSVPAIIFVAALATAMALAVFAAPRPAGRSVDISGRGLIMSFGERKIAVPWTAFTDVRWAGWGLALRVGQENAVPIPARSFPSRDDAIRYSAALRDQWSRERHTADARDILTVSFFLTPTDAHQAGRSYLGLTGNMRRWAAFTALGLVMATISAATWTAVTGSQAGPLVTFGLAGITGLFAMRQDPSYALSERLRAPQGDFCPMTVRLDESGVVETAAMGERRFGWDAVTDVIDGKTLIVLRTGPEDAVVVLKKAFPTPRAADTFLRTAEAYRGAGADGEAAVWPPVPRTV